MITCEQWNTSHTHLSRSAMVSYDESAQRALEGPCTHLSLQAGSSFKSWLPDQPAARPHPDLLAENIRLSEELARVERSKRRCLLQAEQRKAELEQEVSSMRDLIMQMLGREPSLGALAAAAGFPVDSCECAELPQPDLEELMTQNAQLFEENRRLTAELADRTLLDADSARLDYEAQRQNLERAQRIRAMDGEFIAERTPPGWLAQGDASHVVNQQLLSDNRQLQEDKVRLAAELSRAERERRRLVLLEAQSRADLEQCQRVSSPTSSEPAHTQQCQHQVDRSEQTEDTQHGTLVTDPCSTPPAVDQVELQDREQCVVANPEEMTQTLQHWSICHESASVDLETSEKLQMLLHRVSACSDPTDVSLDHGTLSVLELIHALEAQWDVAENRWQTLSTVACTAAEVGTQTWDLDSQVDDDDCPLPLPDSGLSSPALLTLQIEPTDITMSCNAPDFEPTDRAVCCYADDIETQILSLDLPAVHRADSGTLKKTQEPELILGEVTSRQALEAVDGAADVKQTREDSEVKGDAADAGEMQALPREVSDINDIVDVAASLEAMSAAVQILLLSNDQLDTGNDSNGVTVYPLTPNAERGCDEPGSYAEAYEEDGSVAMSESESASAGRDPEVSVLPWSLGNTSEVNLTSQTDASNSGATELDAAALHAVLQQLGEHQEHLRGEVLEAREEYARSMEEHRLHLRDEMTAMQEECGLEEVDRSVQLVSAPETTRDCRSSVAPDNRLHLRHNTYRASEAYADLAADCERHMNSEIMAAEHACAQVAEAHQQKLQEQFAQARGEVADVCLQRSVLFPKGQESQQHMRSGLLDRHAAREARQPVHDMAVDATIQLTAALLNQQQHFVEERAAAALAHARAEAMRAELCRRGRWQSLLSSRVPTTADVQSQGLASRPEPAAATSGLSVGEPQPAPPLEMRLQPRSRDGSMSSDGCCSAELPQVGVPPTCIRDHVAQISEAEVTSPVTAQKSKMVRKVVSLPIPSTEGLDSHEADRQEPEGKTGKSFSELVWKAATPKVHASPPRPPLPRLAGQELDNMPGANNAPACNEEVSCPETPESRSKLCEQESQTEGPDESAALSGAGELIAESCDTDEAALAQEVQQLWEEERRLTASVVAVRFVSETVQAFYEREAVVAARESSEQLQQAEHWYAARTRADSRRAELAQEEDLRGSEVENQDVLSEVLNSSSDGPHQCKSGSRGLSLELRRCSNRRRAHTDVHASSASGSLGAISSSEEESSPSSEFAFQLGPRNSLHKRSCKRRGDTSVWSQIRQYHLAGDSDDEFPPNSARSRASGSGAGSRHLSPRSPRRARQAFPRVGGPRRSKTLPPMELADLAVSEVSSPRSGRRRGGRMRAQSFSHMPRDGAHSAPPWRTSFPSSQPVASRDNSDDGNGGTMAPRRIAGHRRVNSGPAFRHYSNSPVKSKYKRQGSDSLLQVLGTLTPHRRASAGLLVDEPMSPGLKKPPQATTRTLIEGFFHIASGQNGAAEAQLSWPSSVQSSRLEQAVVGDGFCPSPEVFNRPDPAGFSSQPFVFSLLETALDPHGDPSGVLYGCVCSETGGPVDPCTARSEEASDESRNRKLPLPGVLCIVSKLPLFALLFEILGLLRSNLGEAEPLLQRICASGFGESFVTEGVDIADFDCNMNRLRLHLPRPLQCDWQSLAHVQELTPLGAVSQTFAQWQAAWGLSALIARWDNLVGDTLAKLLACVLLEQKVMLLGDVPRISMMALVLRGLIWPFRWLHPYLSAPPPPEVLHVPLPQAPYPLIVSVTELPEEWGYRSITKLPPEVVIGVLNHEYIHVSPELETTGGLKGTSIKLPAGGEKTFRTQVTRAKKKLREGELNLEDAVAAVQQAAETEIQRLADLVRRYVTAQVDNVKKDASANANRVPASPQTVSGVSADEALLERIRESCRQQASDVETFISWFKANNPEASANSETVNFYRTFFQTMLCSDFMNEEINAQTTCIG